MGVRDAMRKDTGVLHITPCAQKGTKKNYEIFLLLLSWA
jgi:hypothetical protein